MFRAFPQEEIEKERKAAARVKEVERAEKVERSRKETERLLARQQADIDRKKVKALPGRGGLGGFRTRGAANDGRSAGRPNSESLN